MRSNPSTPPEPVAILDAAGARQYHDHRRQWIISIPRQNERPSVHWAIQQLEADAGEQAFVVWRRQ
jgi:hypothetical protein